MAFGLFLNFEKLSLEIIENEIAQMTDDNARYDSGSLPVDEEINEEKFLPNLYHGSIAATFIVNLYETTLNTILGKRLGCDEEEILKASHSIKLQIICKLCNVNFNELKSDNSYAIVKEIIKLRNDITHFKNNDLGFGSFISVETKIPMGTSKGVLIEMFKKTYMEKCYSGVMDFLNLLCQRCGLAICKDCEVLDCDGRDALCEFVVDKEIFDECTQDN